MWLKLRHWGLFSFWLFYCYCGSDQQTGIFVGKCLSAEDLEILDSQPNMVSDWSSQHVHTCTERHGWVSVIQASRGRGKRVATIRSHRGYIVRPCLKTSNLRKHSLGLWPRGAYHPEKVWTGEELVRPTRIPEDWGSGIRDWAGHS